MVLMGMELPLPAIRGQIASGVDILIHLGRLRDKSRKVLSISEVTGFFHGEIQLNEVYRFVENSYLNHEVCGKLERTGEFINTDKCARAGISIPESGVNYEL